METRNPSTKREPPYERDPKWEREPSEKRNPWNRREPATMRHPEAGREALSHAKSVRWARARTPGAAARPLQHTTVLPHVALGFTAGAQNFPRLWQKDLAGRRQI